MAATGPEVGISRKPTRKDLLTVIVRLQVLVGRAKGCHGDDRDPHGFEKGQKALDAAFNLCLEAQKFDPPIL